MTSPALKMKFPYFSHLKAGLFVCSLGLASCAWLKQDTGELPAGDSHLAQEQRFIEEYEQKFRQFLVEDGLDSLPASRLKPISLRSGSGKADFQLWRGEMDGGEYIP